MMKKAPAPARVRRNADASRTAILDATERQLVAHGPAAIRLQEVAAEVGVAHPTILHHFGSRERLVTEVVQRRIAAMNGDVLEAVQAGVIDHGVVGPLLDRLFAAFADGGHARVVAFLALSGETNPTLDGINPVTRALHAMRLAASDQAGKQRPSQADSEFIVMLTTLALFGEAIAGPLFRGEAPDAPDPVARQRFLERLVTLVESLIVARVDEPCEPPPPPKRRRRGA